MKHFFRLYLDNTNMKITLTHLRRIIKEEVARAVTENAAADEDMMKIYVAMDADGEDPTDFDAFSVRPEVNDFIRSRNMQSALRNEEDRLDYLHALHDEFLRTVERGEAGGLHVEEPIAPTNYPPVYRGKSRRR